MKSLVLIFCIFSFLFPSDFKSQQIKNARVHTAYLEKEKALKTKLKTLGVSLPKLEIYLRAFKYEREIEIWVRNKADAQFQKLGTMPFCAGSGRLGPKNQQGDLQIPEGFYVIDRFHPESSYYLSLGINYPNAADKARSKAPNLGGDIFIHGKCMSAGCIAITDEGIKELYVLTVEACQNGQNQIPVHIFPARLTSENLEELRFQFREKPQYLSFWQNLKTGYDFFEKNRILPAVTVQNGDYQFR